MAESVLDIVHKISYEVTGQQQIAAVQKQFLSNVESISKNTASLARLQAQLNATSDPRRQAQLTQAIQNRTRAINEQTAAATTLINTDRNFQQALSREIGLVNELNGRLASLRANRDRATNVTDIRSINRQITAAEREQRALASGGSGILSGVGSSVLQGIGIGSGIEIFNSVLGKAREFVDEASRMASELEGVKVAFDRLNNPSLLSQLRVATKGTVSDLELMKQAVQFSNFGLPVDRLAEALKFARIRAKETGQEVGYLVQSIVTGIGRQSPLILDNLGINAKRVADEFQRTGDFAAAAFKIIGEETNKAGADLDTYTERLGKISATIENTQAELGGFFNFAKQGYIAFFQDIVTLGNGAEDSNLTLLQDSLLARVEATQEAFARQAAASLVYQNSYEKFTKDIAKLDFNSRVQRLNDAQKFYDSDLARAKDYYGDSLDAFNYYAKLQGIAFNRLKQSFTATPLNLTGITPSNVSGANRTQLQEAISTLTQQRDALSNADAAGIADFNRRIKILQDADKAFDPVQAIKQKIRNPKFTAEDFAKMKDEILRNYRKISLQIRNEMDSNPQDYLLIPRLRREAETPFNVLQSDIDKATQTPDLDLTAQLSLAEDIFAFEKKKREEAQAAEAQILEERKQAYSEMYQSIVANASNAINSITQSQIDALDREIAYRQTTIEKGKELAERGNTEVLAQEEKALREATAAREAAAQRQIELNGILQASNMAVALSEAIGAIVSAASKGDPYTIAARVIAAVAALVGGVAALSSAFGAANQTGFAEGGYTGDGGKHQVAGTVHKGEFVFDKETTARHRALFERIHAGDYPLLPKMNHETYMPQPSKYASYDKGIGDMKRELRDIKEAVLGLEMNVNATQKTDVNGFSQTVERTIKTNQRRFRT